MTVAEGTGRLVLVGAPIGDPADASPRLAAALESADIVAAEDTRRLRRLVEAVGAPVPARAVSFFEGNEQRRTAELLSALSDGLTVAVITDAGMPTVSDPGYRLVVAAAEAGMAVTCVPGPSAVTTALAVSGLATDRFCFEGFLPRKGGPRRARLEALAAEPRTMVFFEAPHRLADALADLASTFGGDRAAVVCRELTKTYEEVRRGSLAGLAEWALGDIRGEITIVVSGAPERAVAATTESLVDAVRMREAAGVGRKDAIAEVAAEAGVAKREVYAAVVAARNAVDPSH